MKYQVLTYKYRLLPNKKQHSELNRILETCRVLYNDALHERNDAWKRNKKSISYFDQCASMMACNETDDFFKSLPSNVKRGCLKRVDESYKGFFRRVKVNKAKAGFPRFKNRQSFNSFDFNEPAGLTVSSMTGKMALNGSEHKSKRFKFKQNLGKIYFSGGVTSGIKVHYHRPLPDKFDLLQASFKKEAKGWVVYFVLRVECAVKELKSSVGIDFGLKHIMTTDDGQHFDIPSECQIKNKLRKLRATQSLISRTNKKKLRAEDKRRLAKAHKKISNTRNTILHQMSAKIVGQYDIIYYEDLNVQGVIKRNVVESNKGIIRSFHNAAIGSLKSMLEYKAAKAGNQAIKIDSKRTSQTCPSCNAIVKKALSQRTHICGCGFVADRDVAAAMVIKNRGVKAPQATNDDTFLSCVA